MSTTPTDGQKPPRDPNWLRYILIALAIAAVGAALSLNIAEHQAEIIGLALVLITTLVKP